MKTPTLKAASKPTYKSILTLRPSSNTVDHWQNIVSWPRYIVLFLFYFNTFINLPTSIALVIVAALAANHRDYYWWRDGPPNSVGGFLLGPAIWTLVFSSLDAFLMTRSTLHTSYTLTVTIITWIGIAATIPVDITVPPSGDKLPPGGLGLFWFCVAANLLVLLVYFTYFVISCIGVHKHLAFKKAQRNAKMEERIIKRISEQQREADYEGVERAKVFVSKQPGETV